MFGLMNPSQKIFPANEFDSRALKHTFVHYLELKIIVDSCVMYVINLKIDACLVRKLSKLL